MCVCVEGEVVLCQLCYALPLHIPLKVLCTKWNVDDVPCMWCWYHLLYLSLIRCGPIFGAGADLYISSECNMNKDSYSNLLHSYGSPHGSVLSLASSYSFQIEDYEVFKPAITRPHSTAI